jgi:Fe-S-cluster containining protein
MSELPLSYQKRLVTAVKNKAENKKFLERLKKLNPPRLDETVNTIHDEVFEQINCLQCANCCRTTGPLLLQKDVERLAATLKMRPANFTEQYLQIDEDSDYVFKSMPCPFLNNDNYCSVYDNRPNACRNYPHTQQRNFSTKLKITYHNTLICPAVADVVERLKDIYNNKGR